MMTRNSLLWRLYSSYVVLILLLAVAVSMLAAHRVGTISEARSHRSLLRDARLAAELIDPLLTANADAQELRETLSPVFARLKSEQTARLTIILDDGRVVADSHEQPARMENHSDRPEIAAAISAGTGSSVGFSETLNLEMVYGAEFIESSAGRRFVFRAAVPAAELSAHVGELRVAVALASAIAGSAALIIGFLFMRRVTDPLRRMTFIAESIAAGDYRASVDVGGSGEVAVLARAIHQMAGRLREHVRDVEASRLETLAILASMQEGVIAIDSEDRVLHINAAACRILAIPDLDRKGDAVWEVVQSPEILDLLQSARQDGVAARRELRISRGLTDQVVELRSSELLDGSGSSAGAVLVLADASELHRLESVRSEFVSNVSHEMKTPVAAIRGLVESILDDAEMPEEIRSNFLSRARSQCMRLSDLVTDLLRLSVAERSDLVELNAVDLVEPIRGSVLAHATAADEKSIELNSKLPEAPLMILGDVESLRIIIDNLLSNAIRYTPEAGHVSVELTSDDVGSVTLCVRDDGIGIEPTQQERVFERFFRADKARSRELGGTGLGLAIVKHLTHTMRGSIELASQPGSGSVFRVKFPIYMANSTDSRPFANS